jgi:hypothetical protein
VEVLPSLVLISRTFGTIGTLEWNVWNRLSERLERSAAVEKASRGQTSTTQLSYQPVNFLSGRIICLHPIAQPREQGRQCRHVPVKITRHIA